MKITFNNQQHLNFARFVNQVTLITVMNNRTTVRRSKEARKQGSTEVVNYYDSILADLNDINNRLSHGTGILNCVLENLELLNGRTLSMDKASCEILHELVKGLLIDVIHLK